jgi:hypothetical protein
MNSTAKTAGDLKVGDVVLFAKDDLPARITEVGDNRDDYGHTGLYFFAEFVDEDRQAVCDTAFVREAHHPVVDGTCFRRYY